MDKKNLDIVYYSPTHTSETVAMKIAEGISAVFPKLDRGLYGLTSKDSVRDCKIRRSITVFAAPVYAGRLAEQAAQRFRMVKGKNSLAVVVVLYGNRDYEDALVELADLVEANGFQVIAGAAFIGEHSFSRAGMPVAAGRPDASDQEKAFQFGKEIGSRLQSENPLEKPLMKGNRPYKSKTESAPQAPVCDSDLCVMCGRCVSVCPVEAIRITGEGALSDETLCTRCCACIRVCPCEALTFDTPYTEMLYKNFSTRKEPEIFL